MVAAIIWNEPPDQHFRTVLSLAEYTKGKNRFWNQQSCQQLLCFPMCLLKASNWEGNEQPLCFQTIGCKERKDSLLESISWYCGYINVIYSVFRMLLCASALSLFSAILDVNVDGKVASNTCTNTEKVWLRNISNLVLNGNMVLSLI